MRRWEIATIMLQALHNTHCARLLEARAHTHHKRCVSLAWGLPVCCWCYMFFFCLVRGSILCLRAKVRSRLHTKLTSASWFSTESWTGSLALCCFGGLQQAISRANSPACASQMPPIGSGNLGQAPTSRKKRAVADDALSIHKSVC